MNRRQQTFAIIVLLLGQTGCHHYGPRSIVADRISYNEAIASSWKEQTLLNIVKLRYMDTPFFVDVRKLPAGIHSSTRRRPTEAFSRQSIRWRRSRNNSAAH
jgi:hypothetical protein